MGEQEGDPPQKNTHTPALGSWVIRDHSCFTVNPLLHLCFSSNDLQSLAPRGRDSFFIVNINIMPALGRQKKADLYEWSMKQVPR